MPLNEIAEKAKESQMDQNNDKELVETIKAHITRQTLNVTLR